MLRTPSIQALDPALARLARAVATRLAEQGARAWIVGGAVRDLALGASPTEIDMASAATPADVEGAFDRTIPLGRAFGTVVIHLSDGDVQHTTFRSEAGYSDARHPDTVRFGASVAEDASRRDFTCNALYLDPLSGEVLDPCGGLGDLAARRIACVGDAKERFAEDGLRLVRLARFAAGLALDPVEATLRAARESRETLRSVSRERILLELEAAFRRAGAGRFLRLLEACRTLDIAMPGFDALRPADLDRANWIERRAAILDALPVPAGTALGLAALLAPELDRAPEPGSRVASALLEGLKPSRETRATVASAWTLARAFAGAPEPRRSTRVRWMREPAFGLALALARARARAYGEDERPLAALFDEHRTLAPDGLRASRMIEPADLAARGVAPGPLYGEILHEVETRALDLELTTREAALSWLDRRLQDGGNTERKPRAIG